MDAPPIHWVQVALSIGNFAVLVWLLVRFGGPGIKTMLANRHAGIKKDLEDAATLRRQAEERLTTYEARLANIEQEIAELLTGIRREAEADAARILRAAEETAARMRKEGEFVIHQELRRLEIELRHEAATLAVELAKKLIASGLTEADQRRLADQFVRQMAAGPGAEAAGAPDHEKPPGRTALRG